MAEHGAAEATDAQPKPKRSLMKMALLGLNVVLFLVGIGSLAWSKLAPKPPASEMAQTEGHQEDEHKDESAGSGAKGHGEASAKKQDGHGGGAKSEAKGGHGGSAKSEAKGGHGGSAKGGHGGGAKGGGDGTLIPLAPFIVNLSGDNGQRYLRLVAQVEARGDMAKEELESRLPEVRNRLIFLLTSKTFNDIGSVQGKYDLQADITKNINETLDGPFIKKTYFTEFIVQ
ncbi:MAG: flagellar basal body-associated FliL family protein [Candidatus Tectimicrobiota bacterium]